MSGSKDLPDGSNRVFHVDAIRVAESHLHGFKRKN